MPKLWLSRHGKPPLALPPGHRWERMLSSYRWPLIEAEQLRGVMRKPSKVTASGDSPGAVLVSDDLMAELTHVVQFLTDEKWDDGTERQPGTILLLVECGRWKAWINDQACKRTAWVSAPTLSLLLEVVNVGIGDDSLDWRRDRPERSRGKK